MSEEKLKPCPFCGGEARVTGSESLGAINYYCVYCMECNARTDEYAGRQSAIEAWNKRVGDANKTITCFKCHGAGVFGVPYLDDNGEWDGRLDVRKCEVCGHTGKITLALYEKWQKRMRGDKE